MRAVLLIDKKETVNNLDDHVRDTSVSCDRVPPRGTALWHLGVRSSRGVWRDVTG